MSAILDIHNYLRYLILFFLVASIIKGFIGMNGKHAYTAGDKKLNLFALIFSHTQLLLGFILYFTSDLVKTAHENMGAAMKDKALRFWAVEHITMMILAIALVTVGYSLAKKSADDKTKFKKIAIFYTIALLLIIAGIPWPWSSVARPAF
ncbi:MAG: cytochrome b [Bacteroidia bacterium]|nr:cytochrome b [Bacteroidia bacterium]